MLSKHLGYYSTWNVINASALLAGDNTLESKVNGFSFSTRKQNLITWLYGNYLSVALKSRGSSTVPKEMDENEEAI